MDKHTMELDSYSSIDEMSSVDNENSRIAVEIELQGNNSLSQDLFDVSDENSMLNSTCINSDQLRNQALESSVIDIFVTPIQNSKCLAGDQSSTIATIPTIPLSLVPFISTANESWTSDLETPQANGENPLIYHVRSDEQAKFSECKSAKRCSLDPADKILSHVSTPHGCVFACMDGQDISSSPVLNTKKKRRPKRRIMNTIETLNSVDSSRDKCDDIDISTEQICHPSSNNINCDLSDEDENHGFIPEKTNRSDDDEIDNVTFVVDSERSPIKSCASKTEDCLLNDTLGKYSNHEDSEDNFLNDALDDETTDVNNGENNEHNANTETNESGTDGHMQNLLNRLEKLKELEKTRRQLDDHNYVIIPLEEFTKDIQALQKAVMPPPGSKIRSNITKHLDFIPFSKLCVSQEGSSEIREDAVETHIKKPKADASHCFLNSELSAQSECMHPESSQNFNSNVYPSTFYQKFNSEEMKSLDAGIDMNVNCAETVNVSLDKRAKEMKTASIHTIESLGEIEEFSEWIYEPSERSDPAQSSATVLVQNKEINQEQRLLQPIDVAAHKDVDDCEIDGKQTVQINLQDFSNAEGFATASGKPIAISKDRLIKAVQLYNKCEVKADSQCIDNDCMVDFSIPSSANNPQMFQAKKRKSDNDIVDLAQPDGNNEEQSPTTGNKPMKKSKMDIESADIGIPCNTLAKASGNLEEITKHDVNENAETSACTSQFSGFHTASGKTVAVKQSSLNKARALFDEACEVGPIQTDENTFTETVQYKNEKSTISIPQRNIAENDMRNPTGSPMLENNLPVVTTGFNTASGSAIQVSNQALSKVKMLIEKELDLMDCDFDSDTEFQKKIEQFPKSENVPVSTGKTQEELTTVNGKSIETEASASKKSLALSRADKSEIQNNNSTLEDLPGNHTTKNITGYDRGFIGTTTSKPVQRNHYSSDESAIQCENKYTERLSFVECGPLNTITNVVPGTNSPTVSTGFSTATGSVIQVSNQALLKAKAKVTEEYKNYELDSMEFDIDNEENLQNMFKGFSKTNKLSYSKQDIPETSPLRESVNKIETKNYEIQCENKYTERLPFVECGPLNTITTVVSETNSPAVPSGFSTASGSVIQVSNQALLKAKAKVTEEYKNYELDSMEFDIDNEENLQNMFKGFSKTNKLSNSKQDIPETSPLRESVNKIKPKPVNKNISMTMMSASKSNYEYASEQAKSMINLQSRKLVAKNSDQFSEEKENAQNLIAENLSAASKNCYLNKPDFSTNERHNNTLSIKKQIETRSICKNSDDSQKRNRFMDRILLEPQISHPSDKPEGLSQEENMPGFFDEVTASLEALLADEASLDTSVWTTTMTCSPSMLQDREVNMKPMTADQSDDVTAVPASPILNSKPRAKLKTRKRKPRVQENFFGTSRIDTGIVKTSIAHFPDDVEVKLDPTLTRNLNIDYESRSDNSVGSLSIANMKSPTCSHGLEIPSKLHNVQPEELVDILEKRTAAALAQEKCIEMKKRNKPQQLQGSLHLRKSTGNNHRVSWKQFTNGAPPKQRTYDELMNLGIDPDISNITAATALHYRFKCSTYYGETMIRRNVNGVEVGDGAMLIFDENGHAGIEEFERAFMASQGVDPFLVPDGWIKNHYQWIVWKLASMDRTKFGDICTRRMLTPHHVMEQLKYRYDREIDRSERPVLRKIIEKDHDSCRRMVLCVATIDKITKSESSEMSSKTSPMVGWKMKLTDGWYGINASIDEAMNHHIATGKIREGTKLVTYGAELLNCSHACSPLEIPDDVCLHVHTNSTRRVRWDMKLGYQRDTGPMPTSLSNIYVDGGLIGKLKAIVGRVYPEQYYEKTVDGRSVFRNSKCEQKIAMAYETQRDSQIEAMYEVASENFEAQGDKQSIISSSSSISNEELNNLDPFEIFQRQLEAKLRASLPAPRQVTLLLKVRLLQENSTAVLTVWAPNEDMIDILREGNIISIRNIRTASRRWGELQLTAGRLSVIKYEKKEVPFPLERCCTTIPNVALPGFNPPFAEFDTIGIVVSVGPAPQGLKNFEAVYLAHPDPDLANPSYLSILFWDGIDAYGYSDILTVGSTVACTNLQWRRNAPRVILTAYSTENSTFTRNPRSKHLRSAFDVLRVRVKDTEAFASQCAAEIAETLATSSAKASSSVASSSPVPEGYTTPKNPTGISTMKSSIRRRFEKLQWYGEPPNLTPIKSFNSSAKVNQKFVSPLRTPNKTRCAERRVDAPSVNSASPLCRTSECKSTERPL